MGENPRPQRIMENESPPTSFSPLTEVDGLQFPLGDEVIYVPPFQSISVKAIGDTQELGFNAAIYGSNSGDVRYVHRLP